MKARDCGFTFVEVLVVVASIAVLAALLLPALAVCKKKSSKIGCTNNVKQCCLAFKVWEGDNYDKMPMAVPVVKGGSKEFVSGADTFRHFQVMSNELSTPKIIICPNDTGRTAALQFSQLANTNVSYFVGLDAADEYPQRFLTGDRNIASDKEPDNGILKLVPGQKVNWTAAIHRNSGNLGLADGNVWSYSNSGLREALANSGEATNVWRISLPQ